MKPQPLLSVLDVEASSRWYQAVLGLRSGHGGKEYEQLKHGQEMVLQLHQWDAHEHPHLGDSKKSVGNGVAVWFQTEDITAAYHLAMAARPTLLEDLKINPNAKHREFWLKDPDGYVIVVAGKYGDLGS